MTEATVNVDTNVRDWTTIILPNTQGLSDKNR